MKAMKLGTLLFDERFKFNDGNLGKKIIVILNDGSNYPYIAVKTTSKQKNRGMHFGCQNDDRFQNFFLPKGSCYLNENSWIQLEDFRELDSAKVACKTISGELRKLAELPANITKKLLICAIDCDDIPIKHQKILKETLAAYF